MDEDTIGLLTQGNMNIMNPISEKKLIMAGKYAGLQPGMSVLDIGCGNGTLLSLWQKEFSISGTGIELQSKSAARAKDLLHGSGISVIEGDAAKYVPDRPYDVVCALGTSFIFGGAERTLEHLAGFVKEGGSLVIGDRFWKKSAVPPEFSREWTEVTTAFELISTARDLGFTLAGMLCSSPDEWDEYESEVWQNAITKEMYDYLEQIQDEYFFYGRECMGWGCFVFRS